MVAESLPKAETPNVGRPGKPMLWTVERYLAAVEAGILGPDDKVELLEGEIIRKMGQDFPHIDGLTLFVEALRAALGNGLFVRAQMPLRTLDSVPEPDLYVLRGTPRDYIGRYPTHEEVALVAEVSNTTLMGDRAKKSGIYARAGFAEYWILNVVDRQLEVHRNPLPSGVYGEIRILMAEESATLLGAKIAVADLLP